jgi:hypothetical protein
MDARRLRALVIGGAAAATLAVAGAVAADPLPEAAPPPPADPVQEALGRLEVRAANDLARAEAAVRQAPAPAVVVTQAPAVTQSTSS